MALRSSVAIRLFHLMSERSDKQFSRTNVKDDEKRLQS